MNLLKEIADDVHGIQVITDWLGAGGEPVHQGKSEHRASICCGGNMGTPCVNNVAPNWWNTVKSTIADWICEELSMKHRFSIRTRLDDSLHMCRSCGCCLKLKVHTPIKHIQEHVSQQSIDGMPDFCWIKNEIAATIAK